MNMPAMKIPTMKISSPLSASGLTSKSPKVTSSFKMPKAPASFKISQPKAPKASGTQNFNFAKFTKSKIPKAAKMAVVKGAVKKAKNVGF